MAGCCGGSSNTIIRGDNGILVSGSGTPSDPYIVSGDVVVEAKGATTATIATQVTGTGIPQDPFVVASDLIASLGNLADVSIPTLPALENVLKWDGSKWVAGPPAPAPAGAVSTGPGILGTGIAADPIKIAVSDTTSTSNAGTPIYVDTDGKLRALPTATATVGWASVTGKPTTFPPSGHQHQMVDLPGLRSGTAVPANTLGVDGDWYAQYV